MFYVYVLRSEVDGSLYKGHCQNIEARIKQHNSGQTASIKSKIPLALIYKEEFETRGDAINRERYLKSAAGRRFLKKKIGF
jgi:putative endonuclease